jgi:hypothetical protein
MTKNPFLLLFILELTISCNSVQQQDQKLAIETIVEPQVKSISEIPIDSIIESYSDSTSGTEIVCDSVYPNKGYLITLKTFDLTNHNETVPNSVFTFSKLANGEYFSIISDSIFNTFHEVLFVDFNNDNVKDVLIQNFSSARSNLTYYLYLVDTTNNELKRIRGFEEIPNPEYLPEYDLIDNYVMSGKIWTSFYKITGDTIKKFDIVVYDNQTEDGSYDRQYKKAIKAILAKNKGNQ